MKLLKKFAPIATASAIAASVFGLPSAAMADDFTGNVGVYSKYLLRGIGEENSNTAVQGGLDYSFSNGIYLGYWGSNLGYSYETSAGDKTRLQGFENDLYGGYAGSAGMFDYSVGLIQYIYVNVADSDLTELVLSGGIKGWKLQAQYLLTDGWWGNSGDIYWTVSGGFSLPKDFGVDVKLGYYTYNNSDNSKLSGYADANGDVTKTSSAPRHLDIALKHPIGSTGADMVLTYTLAGKDRTDTKFSNSMVMSAVWGFKI
jgi:uncharacterized protein (TIGR02001 family)